MVVADNSPGRPRPVPHTLRLATIGAGRIGSNHAAIVARQIPGVTPAAVSDPVPGTAERLATELGAPLATIALEAIRSVETDRPVTIAEVTA
ncbi:Gfo/Idh/MocA family oxidoreductase [Streptomyces sasae]|uniref:hypothetical protein n=1 Tax=Streptomyces sasae TaxID=1266772 RepID=UPI00292E91BB|nr:hypothetical protein [Streptomyces sasae]